MEVDLILNHEKQFAQALRINQASGDELVDVVRIYLMTALYLRQSLGVKIVMIKGQLPFPLNETASFLPSGQFGNKVVGRSEFNVQVQPFFEFGQASKNFVAFRN